MQDQSPFKLKNPRSLSPEKFCDPLHTAKGEVRASVDLRDLKTLWFNTGTLCNLACKSCYIESSPKNDALAYITLNEVRTYLDEIVAKRLPTEEIAFTGGEPFMNPHIIPILKLCLERGFKLLVLSNAMRPMQRFEQQLLALEPRDRLTIRVSLDHHSPAVHEAERGASWEIATSGIDWLAQNAFNIAIAGRRLADESEAATRAGFGQLFSKRDWPLDAGNAEHLVIFPEMDETADVPEISNTCWSVLDADPASVMCASSRMVVKRKGEATPRVAACTLLPYERGFDLGQTLTEALQSVKLNHPHCARFCVLGGASCSA
jgi:organic radical activating enzyme